MAKFDDAYFTYIKPFEGWYVNIAADKGGETYGGIARKKFPAWNGWTYIDFQKKTKFAGKEIPRNTHFPDIDYLVTEFYRDLWNRNLIGELIDQHVATLLFDYIVHSGATRAIRAIQNIVGAHPDGIMGPKTVAAINKSNAAATFSRLLKQRENFLRAIIDADPSQAIFETGWKKRMLTFNSLMKDNTAPLLLTIALIAAIYLLS